MVLFGIIPSFIFKRYRGLQSHGSIRAFYMVVHLECGFYQLLMAKFAERDLSKILVGRTNDVLIMICGRFCQSMDKNHKTKKLQSPKP